MTTRLDRYEINAAYLAASEREMNALGLGLENVKGMGRGFEPDKHIKGCLGEAGVAKCFNLHWGNVGALRGVDVGGLVEVRAGLKFPTHGLRLTNKDKEKAHLPFVLVSLHEFPVVTLFGWILGTEGIRRDFWRKPEGISDFGYWVPRGRLDQCPELMAYCHRRLAGLKQ